MKRPKLYRQTFEPGQILQVIGVTNKGINMCFMVVDFDKLEVEYHNSNYRKGHRCVCSLGYNIVYFWSDFDIKEVETIRIAI